MLVAKLNVPENEGDIYVIDLIWTPSCVIDGTKIKKRRMSFDSERPVSVVCMPLGLGDA